MVNYEAIIYKLKSCSLKFKALEEVTDIFHLQYFLLDSQAYHDRWCSITLWFPVLRIVILSMI